MSGRGFSFIETIVGAAAGSLILMGSFLAVSRLIVAQQRLISYTELQYETDFVMNSLVNDLRVAESYYFTSRHFSLYMPYTHQEVMYSLKDGAVKRLMKNGQPLTGETELARITITEFSVIKLQKNLLQIKIAAESLSEKQRYELMTVVEAVNISG